MADTPRSVAADITRLGKRALNGTKAAVRGSGIVTLRDVKQRANRSRNLPSVPGLPPRHQTGDYNASMGASPIIEEGPVVAVSVGTNKVQARRLELGFSAPGNHTYPHPHFGPALEVGGRDLEARMAAMLGSLE